MTGSASIWSSLGMYSSLYGVAAPALRRAAAVVCVLSLVASSAGAEGGGNGLKVKPATDGVAGKCTSTIRQNAAGQLYKDEHCITLFDKNSEKPPLGKTRSSAQSRATIERIPKVKIKGDGYKTFDVDRYEDCDVKCLKDDRCTFLEMSYGDDKCHLHDRYVDGMAKPSQNAHVGIKNQK